MSKTYVCVAPMSWAPHCGARGIGTTQTVSPKRLSPRRFVLQYVLANYKYMCGADGSRATHPATSDRRTAPEVATSAGRVVPHARAPHSEVWCRCAGRHTKGLDEII
jgi:hypothetical protein